MITTFLTILLTLDGLVYNVIDWLYDIFVAIATIDVFSTEQETINKIVTNVYVILGVVMLFALAYSLLRAVINPENFSKGDTSFSKLMQNIVVSIIIIAILPMCFNFAYKFQSSILKNDTIPKILFGDSITNPFTLQNTEDDPEPSPGRTLAYSIFNSFLHVDYDKCAGDNNVNVDALTEEQIKGCSEKIALGAVGITKYIPLVNLGVGALNNLIGASDTSSFFYYDNMVRFGKYGFGVYSDFTNSVVTGDLYYMWFFSTVVGVYVAYVLLNFVFDIALRFIKMLFFEIIAPIPVICRIIPGGKMKDVFSTWLKKVISVYLEVFIRVFVIVIGLYLILLVNDMNLVFGTTLSGLGILQRAFARVIIILGIVTFIRQAPKLICDLFHIDSGDMKLGLMDKLAMGGALTAATTIGGAVGTGGRNLVGAVKNIKNAKSGEKLKAGLSGLASVGAGALSGGARGFYSGRGAKNFKDVSKASGSAVTAASAAKEKRDAYRVNYKNSHPGEGAIQSLFGIAGSHIRDTASSAKEYFGINDGLSTLQATQAIYQEGMGFKKELFDLVSDNERVLAYQGMKKSAQEKDINDYVSDIESGIRASGFSGRDNIGYFKTNSTTGQKEYYKDSAGKILNDLTSMAIERKTADIKKYDDAIKLASLNAISEKITKGDGRFTAVLEKSKVWKSQHADNSTVSSMMSLENLNASQLSAINNALASNDEAQIKLVLDALEGSDANAMATLGISSLGIMANDKALKTANGAVQDAIAKKIQEKKKDNK